ncbi:MAG: hypothetical protein HYV63_17670 [Candidatus Schekmanbacteria bacterium]|nr:hypothetical protein [Candidatus Schekmanbacteria bacterium]
MTFVDNKSLSMLGAPAPAPRFSGAGAPRGGLLGVGNPDAFAAMMRQSFGLGLPMTALTTTTPRSDPYPPFAAPGSSLAESTALLTPRSTSGIGVLSDSGTSDTVGSLTQALEDLAQRVASHATFDAETPSEISGNLPPIRYAQFLAGDGLLRELRDLQERLGSASAAESTGSEAFKGLLSQASTLIQQVQDKQVEIQDSLLHLHDFAMLMEPALLPPDAASLSDAQIREQLDTTVAALTNEILEIRTDAPSEETGHVPGVRIMAMKKADRLLSWIEDLRATHSDLSAFPELDALEQQLQEKLQELGGSFGHLPFGAQALAQMQHLASPADDPGAVSDEFPADTVFLHTNPSSWPATSRLDRVEITDQGISFEHSKAGKWKTTSDGVEGNLWIVVEIDGKQYAATVEWLRSGQTQKNFGASSLQELAQALGPHTKKPPLDQWVPRPGEKIGFFVSTPARFGPQTGQMERSNIAWTTWP